MFINETGVFGILFENATSFIFGSFFLSLLALVFLLLMFFTAFNVPIEAGLIFIIPLLTVLTIYTHQFLAVAGVILIVLSLIIAKNWFF